MDTSERWWIKPALAGAVVVAFVVVLAAVLWVHDMDSLKLIVGSTIGFVGMPLGFYFGSSAGSAHKDAVIAAGASPGALQQPPAPVPPQQ